MTAKARNENPAKPPKKPVPATLPTEGYCRLLLILSVLPIGKTTWLDGVRTGRFPKPVHLGRSTLWKVDDIRRVIADIEAGTLPPAQNARRDQGKGNQQKGKANAQ